MNMSQMNEIVIRFRGLSKKFFSVSVPIKYLKQPIHHLCDYCAETEVADVNKNEKYSWTVIRWLDSIKIQIREKVLSMNHILFYEKFTPESECIYFYPNDLASCKNFEWNDLILEDVFTGKEIETPVKCFKCYFSFEKDSTKINQKCRFCGSCDETYRLVFKDISIVETLKLYKSLELKENA